VRLKDTWQRYVIPLSTDYFDVYRDNHGAYFPSGFMGDAASLTIDESCTTTPRAGRTAIRVAYSGSGHEKWAGVYWQNPANNWGKVPGGFDLSGFQKVTFWARGERGGEHVEFKAGGLNVSPTDGLPYGDSFDTDATPQTLTETWRKYSIDLKDQDLSSVIGAFCFTVAGGQNPGGCVFYLDDIRYERALPPESLANVFGGLCVVTSASANPGGCAFFIDDVSFDKPRLEAPRFLRSYRPQKITDRPLTNVAFTYDNALAMLAYLGGGTNDDWRRAKLIGDAFVYCTQHDRQFFDNRLRNAYRAGDLTAFPGGPALLPGWQGWNGTRDTWLESNYDVGSSTGNLAWAMIALLSYAQARPDPEYVAAAAQMGEWIAANCRRMDDDLGGYTGGVEFPDGTWTNVTWRSTEHNIDLYVAFAKLYALTGQPRWRAASRRAATFVRAMWDPKAGHFWTGTLADSARTNRSFIPLDAQAWGVLAFPEPGYLGALSWAKRACGASYHFPAAGGSPAFTFEGFDFNTDRDMPWPEGTAQMAEALRVAGRGAEADHYLAELEKLQAYAPGDDGAGIVAAPADGLTTGYGYPYNRRLHVGATAWFLLAELGVNPLAGGEPAP